MRGALLCEEALALCSSVTASAPLTPHRPCLTQTLLLPLTGSRALSLDASEVMHITATACARCVLQPHRI